MSDENRTNQTAREWVHQKAAGSMESGLYIMLLQADEIATRCDQAESQLEATRAELAEAMETLWNCGLNPDYHDTIRAAAKGAQSIISELRKMAADPGADVQEFVLHKLGLMDVITERNELRKQLGLANTTTKP